MSDFVNYHKRSVTLPPGCKDLTDLFDLATPSSPLAEAPPAPYTLLTKVKKSYAEMKQSLSAFHFPLRPLPLPSEMAWNESGSITLDQIGPLLARVYESQMRVSNLSLYFSEDETVHWTLIRIREPIEASHCVLNIPYASTEQVAAADRIFAAHVLKPRRRENFHLCKPEAPPDIAYIIESMPLGAATCTKLVQALFQALVPSSISAPLKFTYGELRQKP